MEKIGDDGAEPLQYWAQLSTPEHIQYVQGGSRCVAGPALELEVLPYFVPIARTVGALIQPSLREIQLQ